MTGRQLKILMAQYDLTQKELASVTGKAQPTISAYINGKFIIPDTIAKMINDYADKRRIKMEKAIQAQS